MALPSLTVPDHAVEAQSLVALSDVVVSAGGTMNREAAALGVPVYTIYGGRLGGVDEALIREKRLQPLTDPRAIRLEKRRGEELKGLRTRLADVNTAVGGLERRYRSLEKRLTKQIEVLSGRAVKASDLEKRIRAVEADIRRVTGLGGAPRAAATTPKPARRAV